jgi:predicted MarR family transcription regulator
MADKNPSRGPAVNRRWHLGNTPHDAVTTEYEWAILRFNEAFQRYCMQVAHVSGLGSLSYPELILLHVIGMQERPATAGLLARQLNTDTISNIQYSLRKLMGYKLVTKIQEGGGKVYTYDVTSKGRQLVNLYARVRQKVLTEQTASIENVDAKLAETARLVSVLTGLYDEAARISATYNLVDTPAGADGK